MESITTIPIPPAADQVPVVQTFALKKVYRTGFWLNQKIASLKNCTLSVYQGEIFGLLGPNGAGKTTLLKTLLGIIRPTGGRGTLLGQPLGNIAVKQRVGYLPENIYYSNTLTGWEFLTYTAGLFGINKTTAQQRIPQLIERVGLDLKTVRKKQLRQYSKGMVQRIGMAQALINDPDIVFLDEPMSGLDPMGRYLMREIILSLKSQGKTIFFNSHILSDVEQICDRVGILAEGELICTGSLLELLGTQEKYHVKGKGGNPEVLKQRIPDLQFENNFWQGHLSTDVPDFLATLNLMGGQILELSLAKQSLEEYFMSQLRQRGISSHS